MHIEQINLHHVAKIRIVEKSADKIRWTEVQLVGNDGLQVVVTAFPHDQSKHVDLTIDKA